MEIYFTRSVTKEDAEAEISEISVSAQQSIEMGYPDGHGGMFIQASNGYIALTGGGVLYGHISRSVGGMVQSCAILGFRREGSLSSACEEAGWTKTNVYDWVYNFCEKFRGQGHVTINGHLLAPSNQDHNRAI